MVLVASALFAIALTWVTLTPNGAKTENFGELERTCHNIGFKQGLL